jgi:hypothetical protein
MNRWRRSFNDPGTPPNSPGSIPSNEALTTS